jgi:predicted nucleic acid-binding Zn ribbon protein
MTRRTTQEIEFLRREVAPFTDGKTLQFEWAETRATKFLHGMPEFEHQRANLQIAVFAEFEMHHRLLAVTIDEPQRTRTAVARSAAVLVAGENLSFDARDFCFAEAAVECDVVTLRDFVARVAQSIRKLAVVRENEKSRRIKIKPSDAVESRAGWVLHKIDRARAALGVAVRTNGAARFEEDNVGMLFGLPERPSVDLDAVGRGVRPRGQRVDEMAVDRHRARKDQFLALTSCGDARVCQHFLKPRASLLVCKIVGLRLAAWFADTFSVAIHRGSVRSGRYPAGMPIYEYEAVEDGEVIELLRPMKDADAPVEDPAGRGRKFRRRLSVFGVNGAAAGESSPSSNGGHIHSAGCGCGKPMGSCGLG